MNVGRFVTTNYEQKYKTFVVEDDRNTLMRVLHHYKIDPTLSEAHRQWMLRRSPSRDSLTGHDVPVGARSALQADLVYSSTLYGSSWCVV